MTASSEDPTAEADPTAEGPTARPERPVASPLPLPRRSKGPSAIAEAAAALGPAAELRDVGDSGSVSPAPMSAAAAEFAAFTERAPGAGVLGERADVHAGEVGGHRVDVTAVPSRSAPQPARRRKVLLAVAATAVVLLAGSLILMGGDDGKGRAAAAGSGSDTVQDEGLNQGASDAFGSASPSGDSSALEADITGKPGGRPTRDAGSPASGAKKGDSKVIKNGDAKNTDTKNGEAASGSSSSATDSDADAAAKGVLIRGRASGRCIDVTGGSSADHTRLQIWDCTGAARQKWRFASDGTVRALGKCMDVDGGSRQDGAWIKIVECNGTGAQRFRLNAAHDLVNVQAGKCVDVTDLGTGNGAQLQLWTCTGEDNQKWGTG
ncbi:ricin-type beta-trefoil lectin domain protein [Streptomyces sp. NPDC002499]